MENVNNLLNAQIRELEFDSSRHFGLDAVLLVVAQVGLMAYKIFTVIACCYSIKSDDGNSTLVLLSALAAILQVISEKNVSVKIERISND